MVHFEKNGKTGFCLSLLAMACRDPKVTLTHALNAHHYETFTECRNEDSVAEIDINSTFMIWGLNPLLALYSSIENKAEHFILKHCLQLHYQNNGSCTLWFWNIDFDYISFITFMVFLRELIRISISVESGPLIIRCTS